MLERESHPPLTPEPLTRDIAEQYADTLAALAGQIPQVEYSADDILAERKGERRLFNKWDHGLVIFDGNNPVAFVMGYERASEGNDQYPANTIYMSELAVAESHQKQGLARKLLTTFFNHNNELGFLSLDGELNYSTQTNSADWNQHVVDLYKSFGFTERARKEYPNRTDVVLGAEVSELRIG